MWRALEMVHVNGRQLLLRTTAIFFLLRHVKMSLNNSVDRLWFRQFELLFQCFFSYITRVKINSTGDKNSGANPLVCTCVSTWSGEMFPSSATMALRQDREPKRGTASPTRRYLCPFVLNTSVTHIDLRSESEEGGVVGWESVHVCVCVCV